MVFFRPLTIDTFLPDNGVICFFIGFFMTQSHGGHSYIPKTQIQTVHVHFVQPGGEIVTVDAPVGVTLLEVTRMHGIDLEGACDGALACSTCHVIVDAHWYTQLEEPSADEDDMLDLAFGLTPTSRLGCQIIISEALNGLRVSIPQQTRHMVSTMK